MKLITENYLNTLSNKVGNMSDNQKMGLGAGAAAGITATGLGYLGHDLSQEHDTFTEKFGQIQEHPTLEIQAGGIESLKKGDTNITDVLLNKTRIMNGDQSISLADAKNQFINDEKLQALKQASPGVIAGAGAIGAIGARIGSQKPTER